MESEKKIEAFLVQEVKKLKGLCLKFVSPNMRGVPDRICILPGGNIFFVELKSEGFKVQPHQLRVHEYFRSLGTRVYVIDSRQKVITLLQKEIRDDFRHYRNNI